MEIIKIDMIMPMIDEAFDAGKAFSFKPNGKSMLPFIQGGRSDVTIEKYTGGAKKYDILFYRRDDGKYVMHRVIGMHNEKYIMCGDNQWWSEEIAEHNIFAYVTNVGGRSMDGAGYFMYCRSLFLKRFILHVLNYLKRHTGGLRK